MTSSLIYIRTIIFVYKYANDEPPLITTRVLQRGTLITTSTLHCGVEWFPKWSGEDLRSPVNILSILFKVVNCAVWSHV